MQKGRTNTKGKLAVSHHPQIYLLTKLFFTQCSSGLVFHYFISQDRIVNDAVTNKPKIQRLKTTLVCSHLCCMSIVGDGGKERVCSALWKGVDGEAVLWNNADFQGKRNESVDESCTPTSNFEEI